MSRHGRTKEELLMLALYDEVEKVGDESAEVSVETLGGILGIHMNSMRGILRSLVQANFIKRTAETEIRLTPHGRSLVKRLLEERHG